LVAGFVRSVRGNIIRNAKFSEIGDKLGLLGDDCKNRYETAVKNDVGEEGIAALGMAVGKRDINAHSAPLNITFEELQRAYRAATAVVSAVKAALDATTSGGT
jgi:hypothetical protein